MDEKERLDALETALGNELKEREFYLKHAARTLNPMGKTMFGLIADDELEHYERLKSLHEKWKNRQAWPDTIPLTVAKTNVRTLLADLIDKAESTAGADENDLDAVRIAIEFETRGIELYTSLSEASQDPKEKDFFSLLASLEREHFLSLKDAEEYMKDPSSWFVKKEHHGLDGG